METTTATTPTTTTAPLSVCVCVCVICEWRRVRPVFPAQTLTCMYKWQRWQINGLQLFCNCFLYICFMVRCLSFWGWVCFISLTLSLFFPFLCIAKTYAKVANKSVHIRCCFFSLNSLVFFLMSFHVPVNKLPCECVYVLLFSLIERLHFNLNKSDCRLGVVLCWVRVCI